MILRVNLGNTWSPDSAVIRCFLDVLASPERCRTRDRSYYPRATETVTSQKYPEQLEHESPTTTFLRVDARMARDPFYSTDPVMILNVQSFLRDRLQRLPSGSELLGDWNRFYESYDRIIRRFAMACGMQDCDIDECSQEVWVAVVHGLKSFELDASRARFRSWLYGIVKNKAADLVRDRVKHNAVSLDDSSTVFDLEDDGAVERHDIRPFFLQSL